VEEITMRDPLADYPYTTRNPDGTCTCGACREAVRPAPRDPLGYAAFAAALGMSFVALPVIAVLPPINMMLVPPTFLLITNLWGFSTEALWGDRRCPSCRRALVFKPA